MDLQLLRGAWEDYDIERHNPPRADVTAAYQAASRDATAPRMRLGLAYGPREREKLDLLAPDAARSPAIIFIHGGYWRAGAREARRFPASFFVPRGVAWISAGYPLAPAVTVPQIAGSIRRALAFIHRNASELGLDAGRLIVAGNSAGAHLAALALLADWPDTPRPPKFRGAALLSGLYDLAPYVDYELGRTSGITRETFAGISPLRMARPLDVPVAIGVGEKEPPKFQLQTRLFAEHLRTLGAAVEEIPGSGRDHFSIIAEFGREGPLTRALLKMI